MNKKLLAALMGATLAAGAGVAAADVQLVGHIDTSIDAVDVDGGPADDINLHCTTCSLGVKGSEDLGNGLKAIFFIDFQYNTTERGGRSSSGNASDAFGNEVATDSLTDRDQWVGLSGPFGQVRVGTISTLYKSHGAMIDPLYRTALQGRDHGLQSPMHSGAGEELQGRATNTIRWDSMDYNGVKVGAHYTLDNNETDGEDSNPYGVGASYENGGLLVFGDYMNNDQNDARMTAGWKVGGKYDMGLFSFMGQYEDFDDASTFNDDVTLWHVAAGVNGLLGMNIYVGIGHGDNDDTKEDYTAWTLAVSHNFSKNTTVYVGHAQYDCSSGGGGSTLAICTSVGVGGGENDQTSFGLKHTF